jgi:peroxiredoxin
VNIAEISARNTVLFFYPAATGKPDMPKEWDLIPGARGCTSQNCAYRDHYREFRDLGLEVFGISAQRPEDQKEFAARMGIPYQLLSDSAFELTEALRLPTFEFQGRRYIKRITIAGEDGRIKKVFYPVFPPDRNAEAVLAYLRGR